jgi:hypothetical protein
MSNGSLRTALNTRAMQNKMFIAIIMDGELPVITNANMMDITNIIVGVTVVAFSKKRRTFLISDINAEGDEEVTCTLFISLFFNVSITISDFYQKVKLCNESTICL